MDARVTFIEGFGGVSSSRPIENKALEDLLAEPIVQMLMARDGVEPDEIRRLSAIPHRRSEPVPRPAEPLPSETAEATVKCLDLFVVTGTQQLLEEAAALQRKPVREFVLDSAMTAARRLIRRHRTDIGPCSFREPHRVSVGLQS